MAPAPTVRPPSGTDRAEAAAPPPALHRSRKGRAPTVENADAVYGALIRPIEFRMMSAIARVVGNCDDAADVLQESLAEVWQRLPHIRRHPNPHGYIMCLCLSRAWDAVRARERRRRRESSIENLQTEAAIAPTPDGDGAAVRHAIARLPRQQARALLMRTIDEMSYGDVARALGCREATARSHVAKAREKLRRLFREEMHLHGAHEKE